MCIRFTGDGKQPCGQFYVYKVSSSADVLRKEIQESWRQRHSKLFIASDLEMWISSRKPPQNHLMVHQLSSSRLHHLWKWQLRRKLYTCYCFSLVSVAMVVPHTHFALLYLRGGLCWDWSLGCRRSTSIFTSENKSIQTLNITVTCKSSYAFTQNGVGGANIFMIQMKLSSSIQVWKSKNQVAKSLRQRWRH